MRKALLCWLLLALPVCGQTLAIAGNKQVEVYKLVRLKADAPAANSAILWDVTPEDTADVLEFDGELLFTGPPGKYRVTCSEITIVGTKPVVRRTRTTVEIVGTPVPPGPTPTPTPTPVVKQGYFIIVVEETKDAASNRAAYFTDPALAQRVKDNKHKWLVFDKDVVDGNGVRPRDLVFYIERATGKPLPRLFLVGLNDSKIHYEGDAPKSAAELVKLLESKGG